MEGKSNQIFRFDGLKAGKLGLSPAYGAFVAEAASYCLFRNHHHSPGSLILTIEQPEVTSLLWDEVNADLDPTWADLKEAAEYGAYAVALVVCFHVSKFSHVARCAQSGTGIDIWLTESTDDRGIFQHSARLEVSGIFNGGQSAIKARLRQKLEQTKRSDHTMLPAFVAVVEFGLPEIRMQKRGGICL
jgi:hypothetical protein